MTAFSVRGEPISYAEAIHGPFVPINDGDRWGPPWSTTWFRVKGRVPMTIEPVAPGPVRVGSKFKHAGVDP